METFGIGVSHTHRSQDGQSVTSPEITHTIYTTFVYTHRMHTVFLLHVCPFCTPVNSSGRKHPVKHV